MKEQNGIAIFVKGDSLPSLPTGLLDNFPVISRFGFKISEIAGKPYWEAASESDYRRAEGQRLGISDDKVKLPDRCRQTGPRDCDGHCTPGSGEFCSLGYDPKGQFYFCTCA
jgi:hypothetical protein